MSAISEKVDRCSLLIDCEQCGVKSGEHCVELRYGSPTGRKTEGGHSHQPRWFKARNMYFTRVDGAYVPTTRYLQEFGYA